MRLKTTMVSFAVGSALAAVLAGAPTLSYAADEQGKNPTKARVTTADDRLLKAEAAARKTVDADVQADLTVLQNKIANHVKRNGTKHSFGSYVDASTGAIVLETDAPTTLVASLTSEARAKGRTLKVRATKVKDNYSRKYDIPAYWGGAGVTASVGTAWCSTGFTVQNSAGTRFQVTAGHCFNNGTNVYTELGGRWMGTVSGNGISVGQDMELIGGSSYWGYHYTGGTNSSTGIPVVGAGDPVVGYADYCHSGRTTGENCGHKVSSNFAQVCTQSGCKYPVTAFTGGTLPQGGDSGSPFYVKSSTSSWARGIIIAGNGTTSYAEKWSRIASRFGVSITTS